MAAPKRVTFFKARLEDKPGALLAVAQNLKSRKIGLVGLWGFATRPGEAEVYCIPKDADKFRDFTKATGMTTEEGVGFLLKGADKTGALVKSLEAIAKAGVNIIALEAIAAGANYGAFLWVNPADLEKTGKALGAR